MAHHWIMRCAGYEMDTPSTQWGFPGRNLPYGATILLLLAIILQAFSAWMAIRAELYWAFLPLGLTLSVLCFAWPRVGLVILVASWFFREAIFGIPGFFPADYFMLVTAFGYVVRQVALGRNLIPGTPLNFLIVLWMAVYALPLITNAIDLGAGLKYWFRHWQMFFLFFIIVEIADKALIRRCLRLFLSLCVVIGIGNIAVIMIVDSGSRVFGPAGVLFSGFLALAAALLTSHLLLDEDVGRRRFWALCLVICVLAEMANQSRGAMVQLLTGVVAVVVITWLWDRRHSESVLRGRIRMLGGAFLITGILVLAIAAPLIQRVLERYSSRSGSELHTLQMRGFLWRSAVQVFREHPLLGVGPAQSLHLTQYLPNLRFDPVESSVRGVGVHNSVLEYLAESGLIGSIILFCILWRSVALGRYVFRLRRNSGDAVWMIGIWGAVFVIVTRYLYEGHLFYSISGMTTAAFIAMLYVYTRSFRAHPTT